MVLLQRPVHPFLQPQWISSWQDFDASGTVVKRGCHPEASFVQHQSDGLCNSGFRTRVWFQQLPWRAARLMCLWSAACVGVDSTLRAFLTLLNTSSCDIVKAAVVVLVLANCVWCLMFAPIEDHVHQNKEKWCHRIFLAVSLERTVRGQPDLKHFSTPVYGQSVLLLLGA